MEHQTSELSSNIWSVIFTLMLFMYMELDGFD